MRHPPQTITSGCRLNNAASHVLIAALPTLFRAFPGNWHHPLRREKLLITMHLSAATVGDACSQVRVVIENDHNGSTICDKRVTSSETYSNLCTMCSVAVTKYSQEDTEKCDFRQLSTSFAICHPSGRYCSSGG